MVFKTVLFNDGVNGATVNSTANGNFTAVTPTNWTYSSAGAVEGGMGVQMVANATSTVMRDGITAAKIVAGLWVNFPSVPTGNEWHLLQADGGGPVSAGLLMLNAAGIPRLTTKGTVTRATGTSTVPTNVPVWCALYLDAGTTATTGTARAAIYTQAGGNTPVWDSGDVSGIDIAGTTAQLVNIRFGKNSASTFAIAPTFDTFVYKTDADAVWPLLPYTGAVNQAPTVTAPAFQTVSPGATVSVTFGESDDPGVTSRATVFDYAPANPPTINNAGSATSTFTAGPAGSLYVIRRRVTDAAGLYAETTTEVRVPQTGDIRPLSSIPVGDWTISGGTNGTVLNDDLDSTYFESPVLAGSETTVRFRLEPSAPRASATVTIRLAKTDTGSANLTVRLFQGLGATIPLETWTIAPTTSIANYSRVLSQSTIDAVTDWGGLRLEIGATS